MKCSILRTFSRFACPTAFALALISAGPTAQAEPVVPGTGQWIETVGDDFEDEYWTYIMNLPKASSENDHQTRRPAGYAQNLRWMESTKRGQPDYIHRVPTPEGGLPGSEGSLLLRTLQTGIPGRPSYRNQQDDLLLNINRTLGGYTPVHRSPSLVVRVFVPPFEEWENRTGTSFGLRAGLRASNPRRRQDDQDPSAYWPGFFIEFRSETDPRYERDQAFFRLRADQYGRDFAGPEVSESTWYTLGMSFTRDGMVHYYLHEGVEDLTAADHLSSQYPYGFRCARFSTFFFNIANGDNGRDWSTPWIIDDPRMYMVRNVAQTPNNTRGSR